MLSEIILRRWREASAIHEQMLKISSPEFHTARAFLQELREMDSDKVRSKLSQADEKLNRNLAWLLLDETLQIDLNVESEQAQRLIEWTEFIAAFGGLENRADNLDAHCKFYRGVLQHRAGSLSDAALLYAQAEIDYRDHSSPVPQSLVIYAQGSVALEQGNVEGQTPSRPGARELFQKALDVLDKTADQKIRDELKEIIERSLRQRQLINELISSDQPETLLKNNSAMIDLEILSLLKAQTINLARNDEAVAKAAHAARLTDLIAARLQQPSDATQQLLNFYLWSKNTEAAEWLLREQLKGRPHDLELQKTLARTLILHGKNQEAMELLKELVETHSNDALIQSMFGTMLYLQGDLINAEIHFRRALEIDPKEAGAIEGLRQIKPASASPAIHFKDGNLTIEGDIGNLGSEDLAAGMTAAILAANPQTLEVELNKIAQSDPQLAQRVAELLQRQGVLAEASEPPAMQHYHQAEQFFSQGRWPEAIREYKLTVEADPDFAEAYMGWGDVYYRIGMYHLAIAYFEESIAIKPAPFTYRFLGDSYLRINKRKQAEESFQQALKLDPGYARARDALQRLRGMEG